VQLSLVTFQLCNFGAKNFVQKMLHKILMKLTTGWMLAILSWSLKSRQKSNEKVEASGANPIKEIYS
jgi:hypothetical protein